jgi:hypothetical protein
VDCRNALEQVRLFGTIEPKVVDFDVVDPYFPFAHKIETDAEIRELC